MVRLLRGGGQPGFVVLSVRVCVHGLSGYHDLNSRLATVVPGETVVPPTRVVTTVAGRQAVRETRIPTKTKVPTITTYLSEGDTYYSISITDASPPFDGFYERVLADISLTKVTQ